jgi:hypothetical protein
MSWVRAEIEVDGSAVSGWAKENQEFTIPFSPDFGAGDRFKVGRKTFVSVTVTNVAGRSEQLLISGKEVNNVEPKERRDKSKSGRKDLRLQDKHGHDNED